MNTGSYIGAAIATGVVRTILNSGFYGFCLAGWFEDLRTAHPGVFREVIPGYIATDFIFAFAFVYLFAKAGSSLGGGVKGGVCLGILIAILSPVLGILYQFFGVTFLTVGMVATDMAFQVVAHMIVGAVAGAIYKP